MLMLGLLADRCDAGDSNILAKIHNGLSIVGLPELRAKQVLI